MKSNLEFLRDAESKNKWDPPSQFKFVRQAVKDLAIDYMRKFGSAGKAV